MDDNILKFAEAVGVDVGQLRENLEVIPSHDTPYEYALATEGGRVLIGVKPNGTTDIPGLQGNPEVVSGSNTPYEYALATEGGRVLLGVKPDGTTDIPGFGGGAASSSGLYFRPDGSVGFGKTDVTNITTWGSSTLDYLDNILSQTFVPHGAHVNLHAKGGEWIEHTAARLGSAPAIIRPVTIPASGSVVVEVDNFPASMDFNYAMKTYTGWLGGVLGTLSATREQFTFTRSTPGDSVTLAEGTPLIPEFGPQSRKHITIFAAGKNNLTQSATAQEDVIAYTDNMVRYLDNERPSFLILGNHNNTGWSNESVVKQRIRATNKYFEDRYGPLFIDVEALCTSPDIWDRTGITPTEQDLTEQALGNLPPSLAIDSLHFNTAFNNVLAEEVEARTIYLGWY